MAHLDKERSALYRNLKSQLTMAQKLVADTEKNLFRLKKLDAEAGRLARENSSLQAENASLKKRMEAKIGASLKEFDVKMDPHLFSKLPGGVPGDLEVTLILPDREKLGEYQKKTLTRLTNALHNGNIATVRQLQQVGGLEYFESSRNAGEKSLKMLSASMHHHGIEWKRK